MAFKFLFSAELWNKLLAQRWVRILILPSAFKIGLLVTLLFSYGAHEYYLHLQVGRAQDHQILRLIDTLHQKSVDWRMLTRGERAGTDKVIMVTIDEASLEKMGRWPWPRDQIAKIINSLLAHDIKAMGFDIIFAESDTNQTLRALDAVKSVETLSPEAQTAIQTQIEQADTDQVLAKAVKAGQSKLVMGAYFDSRTDQFYPFQELCAEVYLQQKSDFLAISKQAQLVPDLDEVATTLPEGIKELLSIVFQSIEDQHKQEFGEVKTPSDQIDLDKKIEAAKETYCDRFLTSKDEHLDTYREAWAEISQKEDDVKGVEFDTWLQQFRDVNNLRNPVERTGRWWINFPKLGEQTVLTGFFNAFLDSDGTIRKTRLVSRYGGRYFPSLPFQMFLNEKNSSGALLRLSASMRDPGSKEVVELMVNDSEGEKIVSIPVDEEGRLAVNYAGPRYMFPHLSAVEVISDKPTLTVLQRVNGRVTERTVNKAEFLKDKLVLLGATAVGIFDLRVTPFDENFPGLETHANVLDNLIRNDFMLSPSDEVVKMPLFMLLLGLLLSLILKKIGAVAGLLSSAVTATALYYIDQKFLFGRGLVIAIVLPLIMSLSIYVMVTFYKYLTEERKKKALKGTFEKYVSPSIVNEILAAPGNIELGGKKVRMSVMFSDVRGFTTISEKLDPQVLTKVLNTYLTPMTKLVFDNKGTLDKYMGDAIMAFFGAPVTDPDHAKYACRCALQMMEKLREIQIDFKAKNMPEIDIGIGINTGEMNVGNMGSDIVRSYTVMGDSVNLGSRLEGINKEYGTHIIISEFTYEDIKNEFVCREVDRVRVKGKRLPVRIFELVAEGKVDDKTQKLLKYFSAGYDLYLKQDWTAALTEFNAALATESKDSPTQLFIERCQTYLELPPPSDWDGVYEMKTK
jgi:adenylate cyclase